MASTDTPELTTLLEGAVLLKDDRGSAQLTRIAPGELLFVCTGFLTVSFYEPMVEMAQREMDAHGELALLVDGWNLRSVDTGFREAWTLWFEANRQQFHMRLLVRSRLMEMAADIANVFAGVALIETYSTRRAWERACSDDFSGFQPPPTGDGLNADAHGRQAPLGPQAPL